MTPVVFGRVGKHLGRAIARSISGHFEPVLLDLGTGLEITGQGHGDPGQRFLVIPHDGLGHVILGGIRILHARYGDEQDRKEPV